MNLSGRAVQSLLSEYGLIPADLVLALDDFILPLGKIRIRERGSAGGHNGLESVTRALETEEFVRVRLGIGEEKMPEDKADFVLSEFAAASEPEVKEMISKARDAVKTVLGQGLSRAMSIFNA
jgi:PTH1 family peptidyl-tRNA hydrolase